jgi:hypothetical protein
MYTLKLKVHAMDGDRRIENFSKEQWEEICIIFHKLVRNIKEEIEEVVIADLTTDNICYISMEVDFPDEMKDEKVLYIFDYLQGEYTENPVYFNETDEPVYAGAEIIFENDPDSGESLLDRFNRMAIGIREDE